MKIIVLLSYVAVVLSNRHNSNTEECETVSVYGIPHRKEVLARGLNRPYQLSIYKDELGYKNIFFSYNVGKHEEDTFEIGYIEKGKENVTVVEGVRNGFASAVDQDNHHVYLGGSTGIYKYHLKKKKHEALEKIIGHHNIWYMFFKKYLYFIDFPSQKLYKYNTSAPESSPEHQEHISEKIYQFVIDKDNDQFITTGDGLYRIKHGSNERLRYSKETLFRGVALNNNGLAYFCGNHSIYVTNKQNHALEPIANVKNVFGITFDRYNIIIYSDPKNIIKLVPGDCK